MYYKALNNTPVFFLAMRFAHLADCHIGSWRDPKMRLCSLKAFEKAVSAICSMRLDFTIIAGDLFNSSLPPIDVLKKTVELLKKLKDNGIPVYVIAGSHDFSPSGKTMLDVLETAGLAINLVKGSVINKELHLKFTEDRKTGAKLTGMLGKKGSLEKSFYEQLSLEELENEGGFKVFAFHSALSELKPKSLKDMDSMPLSFLPKGFAYYAGGHVHEIIEKSVEGYGKIVFPGPLFPNSFSELEKLGTGGFYVYDNGNLEYKRVVVYNTLCFEISCTKKAPEQIESEIYDIIKKNEFINTIVCLRLKGELSAGKLSDINFHSLFNAFYDKGAYFVMKNSSAVTLELFEEIKVREQDVDVIEQKLIEESLGKLPVKKEAEKELIIGLMKALDIAKQEDERQAEFEIRLKEAVKSLIP